MLDSPLNTTRSTSKLAITCVIECEGSESQEIKRVSEDVFVQLVYFCFVGNFFGHNGHHFGPLDAIARYMAKVNMGLEN